jgi:hypothetical protein
MQTKEDRIDKQIDATTGLQYILAAQIYKHKTNSSLSKCFFIHVPNKKSNWQTDATKKLELLATPVTNTDYPAQMFFHTCTKHKGQNGEQMQPKSCNFLQHPSWTPMMNSRLPKCFFHVPKQYVKLTSKCTILRETGARFMNKAGWVQWKSGASRSGFFCSVSRPRKSHQFRVPKIFMHAGGGMHPQWGAKHIELLPCFIWEWVFLSNCRALNQISRLYISISFLMLNR